MSRDMASDPALAVSSEEEAVLFAIVVPPIGSVDPGAAALVESAIRHSAVRGQGGQPARLFLRVHRNRVHEPSTTYPTSSSESSRLARFAS